MRWWIVDRLQPFRVIMFIAATAFGTFVIYAATPRPADPQGGPGAQ